MTKFRKIFASVMAASVALVMTAGIACLTINCSSDESGRTLSYVPAASELYEEVDASSYSSLSDAITSNLSTTESEQKIVKLSGDYTLSAGETKAEYTIPAGNYITIDLNGHNIVGNTTTRAFQVKGTLTVIDSTQTYSEEIVSSAGTDGIKQNSDGTWTVTYYVQTDIAEYKEITYTAGSIYGGKSTNVSGTFYAETGGTLNFNGGIVHSTTLVNGGAVYGGGSSSAESTFNMNGGVFYGSEVSNYGGAVYLKYTTFNMNAGAIVGSTASYGGAVYVCNSSTMNFGAKSWTGHGDSAFETAYVAGCTTENSGTFYVTDSSVFNSYENAVASFNEVGNYGSFVYSSSCDVTVSGSLVTGNTAGRYTTIYVKSGNVKFDGPTFLCNSQNSTSCGGLALYATGSTAEVVGGTYAYGSGAGCGGAFDTSGSAVMSISDAEIYGNSSSKGGGVYAGSKSTVTLTNVYIHDNQATTYGGGVYEEATATLTISDSVITGNTAGTSGAGIYALNSVSVSGRMVVNGNSLKDKDTEENVLLAKDMYVTLDGVLSVGSHIGITFANESQTQATSTESSTTRYKSSCQYFYLDKKGTGNFFGCAGNKYVELVPDSSAVATVTWAGFEDADPERFDSIEGAILAACVTDETHVGTAKPLGDVDVSSTITVPEGFFAALDLDGKTVTWTGSSQSNFFIVYGNFTLTDSKASAGTYTGTEDPGVYKVSSTSGTEYMTVYDVMDDKGDTTRYYYQSGAITGGMATYKTSDNLNARGGAFYVGTGATMDMYGGTLYNNTGTYAGAVHTLGTFTMYGGSVSGNVSQNSSTNHNGAGFLNEGTLYLSGGVIYGNTTPGKGYGGAIENANTLYMQKIEGVTVPDDDTGLKGVVISGNYSSAYGGGIFNECDLYIYDGYITLNESKSDGAGIDSNGGPVYMYGGYITGNTSGGIGGGVCSPSSFYMCGGHINNNTASSYGGGIYTGSTSYFYGGEIAGNTASKYGGGISTISTLYIGNADGDSDYTGSMTISGNTALTNGGGIYSSSNLYIYDGAVISGNTASDSGGGVYGTSKIYIQGGTISNNTVKNYGGGVYASASATLEISGGTISGNEATSSSKGQGAGIAVYGTATMSGGSISDNVAGYYGGALIIADGATFTMTDGEMSGNEATRAGAVSISGKGSTFYMYGGTIKDNESTTGNGGGVYAGNSGTYFTMTAGMISGNTAADCAGGVFCNDKSTVKLLGGTITGNHAKNSGAGVYYVSSASVEIGGGLVVKENTLTGATGGDYDDDFYVLSGTKITIDEDFAGEIYIFAEAAPSFQLSSNSFTRDKFLSLEIPAHLISVQGYCVGLNSSNNYIYVYEKDDPTIIYVGIETDETTGTTKLVASYYCSQCFQNVGDCSDKIEYMMNDDGSATAYVEEAGCTCYGLGAPDENGDRVVEEGGTYLNTGVLLDDGEGNVTWYPDVESAFAAATGECTVTLLGDITLSENEVLSLEANQNITLDLNGHTIDGDVEVSGSGSLTITDSRGGGAITGDVSGTNITISISGGTYSEESFAGLTLADGFYGLYSKDDGGNVTYTVYSKEEMETVAVAYIAEYDESKNETGRIYYSLLGDAVICAVEGDTVTLCRNLDMTDGDAEKSLEIDGSVGNVTIDLNGFVLTADIKITAGTVTDTEADPAVSLAVSDSSEDKTGRISGTITVTGTSSDGDVANDETNSFKDTLTIAATAVDSSLEVNTEELTSTASTSVEYSFSAITEKDNEGNDVITSYGITKGHEHVYSIAEAYEDEQGNIKIKIKCSCGNYYQTGAEENKEVSENDATVFDLPDGTEIEPVENDDGTVTYYISEFTITETDEQGNTNTVGTFTADYTVTPLVKIEITNSDGTTETVYLDETTIGNLGDVISKASGSVTVTLWDNVDLGEDALAIADCDVTIDLAGYTLSGEITMSSTTENGASLGITDSSSVMTTVDENGETETSYVTGTGVFDCTISVSGDSAGTNSLTLSGGTYSSEAVTSIETAFGGMESCLPEYDETDETSIEYAVIYNLDGSATVTTAENAANEAAVTVTIGDTEMYFSSVQAAVNYVENYTPTGDEEVTIKLLADCEEDIEIKSGSVSIDLNGNTISGDVTVADGATLNLSDTNEETKGHIDGKISGDGTVSGLVVAEVIGDDGSKFYYTNIETAASSLEAGNTLVILDDLGSADDPVYINVTVAGGVTIDLGGKTVYGDVTSSDDTELTIKDSAAEDGVEETAAGILSGSVSGSSVTITSGTYTQDVGAYVAEDKVMLVVTDEAGDVTYTVVDGATVPEGAVVSVTDENGNVTYYTDIETAIASVGFGEAITLLDNVTGDLSVTDAGVFTIDLNGKTVTGDVTVSGNTSLTITDSSAEAGGITGNVDVEGSADLVIEAGSYSCDVSAYTAEGKVVLITSYVDEEENVVFTYTVVSEEYAENNAAASVTLIDGDGNETTVYFFDDIDDAVSYACGNSADGTTARITLYDDVTGDDSQGINITSGDVIFDFNGHEVDVDITVGTGAGLTITGDGDYKGESDIGSYLEEGLVIYVSEDGTQTIVDENYAKENAAVSVTVNGVTTYYGDINDAINSLADGGSAAVVLLDDVELDSDDDTWTITGNVTMDLNGHTFTGDVVVGTSGDGATGDTGTVGILTIVDSSAEGGKGEGFFDGEITTGSAEGSTVTVTGGTFTDEGVQGMLGQGCFAITDANGNTVVVAESDLNNVAAASVTTDSGTTYTYYESLDMALAAAAEEGGTVKILQDAEMTGDTVEISTSVTIDLNGHTAAVDISLDGDSGSLTICDSSVEGGGDAGTLTGTVKVTGTKTSTWDENPYADALTMENGVAPNGDLTIDLTELGDGEYFFDAITDDTTGEPTGEYGIVKDHEHTYNIEVWTFTEGGGLTLDYMCACGEMWEEDSIVADVEVKIDEDGNYVFTATVYDENGEVVEYEYTADIAATVTVDGETYYFETLEAALDFTTTVSDSTLTLQKDCDEVADIIGNVTVDLNGHDLGGINAEAGSSVTVTGDGYVSSLDVDDDASVKLRGGTYGTGDLEDVETYVDRYNGYTVYADEEGNVFVDDENYAKMNSAASVTDSDGNVTYYETLEEAVKALADGDTLTLYSDASDETITIDKENITIDLNNCNLGELVVEDGAGATITGNGEVGAIDGEGKLNIRGGTYGADDLDELEDLMDSDYAILVGAEGSYTVLTEEDAEEKSVASVTFTDSDNDTVTLYFTDMQAALALASSEDYSEVTVTLTGDYSGDIAIVGDMTLDLAGYTVEGDIEVAGGVSAEIVGTGTVTGEIVTGDGTEVSVTGGTYYDGNVQSYVADGYVAVAGYDEDGNAVYTVMTEDEAKDSAAAYVEYTDEDGVIHTEYYASAEDAINAAIENGGKITLTDDVYLGETEYTITDGLEIDLNGHTIYGNFVVDTDEGGSLKVIDSSEDDSGSMEGTIKVTGSGETDFEDNPYENALVFSDGATPNGSLTIDLDELASGDTAYVFADAGDGRYVISDYSTHEHVYDIAVWEYDYETGTVTVKFMCACGSYEGETFDDEGNMTGCDEYTIYDVTVDMNGDGTATVTCSYVKEVKAEDGTVTYETYDCVMTIDVAASVTVDGETHYFENFEEALAYACEKGGTLVLSGDITDAAIAVDGNSDVTIDLAGHTLDGSVYVSEGSTLTIKDSSEDGCGLLEAALNIDGTLIIDGASMALTEDSEVGSDGEIIFTGDSSVDLGGNTLTGVTGIDGNLDVSGTAGSTMVLADDVEIPEGSSMNVDGDLTIDVNGNDFAGDINVGDDASLTIKDSAGSGSYEGTITLGEDSSLTMENGTYSENADIDLPEGMVLQSTTGSDGEPAYEVVSKSDHEGKGHGLDKVISSELNAETSTITIEFECMCGETVYRTVPVTEADYTTMVVVVDGEEKVLVEYSLTSTATGDNDITYSYSVSGYAYIDMYTEGVSDDNYSFAVAVQATCETEGEEVYTYGQGRGVVVRVATPKDHDWESSTYTDADGNEHPCYKCGTCDRVVLSEDDEVEYDNETALASDIEAQEDFDDVKSGILRDLRDETDKLLADLAESLGEDSDAYKAIEKAVEEVYDEYSSLIENTEYEAMTGENDDRDAYLAELESVLNETLVDATQSSYEVSTEYMVDALYQELWESGKYDEAALSSLDDIFDELVSDLGKITVDSIDDMKAVYDAFYDRAQAALMGVSATTAFSTEDSDYSGSVASTEGMSSSVDLEIIEVGSANVVVDMDSYVYVGDGDLTEDDIAGLVEGKGVAAVFEISLKDTASGTYVYRYKGTYVVSIKLSDELLSYGGLQVIYIGADGKAEIYDTTVTDDGYLVFTTTHFSEFIILSSDVEPDAGAAAGEEVPAVPGDGAGEDEGATAGRHGGKPPVEIIVVLAIIAACALAIIIIMCESSKSGKKS